jgi:hypothetical protein
MQLRNKEPPAGRGPWLRRRTVLLFLLPPYTQHAQSSRLASRTPLTRIFVSEFLIRDTSRPW